MVNTNWNLADVRNRWCTSSVMDVSHMVFKDLLHLTEESNIVEKPHLRGRSQLVNSLIGLADFSEITSRTQTVHMHIRTFVPAQQFSIKLAPSHPKPWLQYTFLLMSELNSLRKLL